MGSNPPSAAGGAAAAAAAAVSGVSGLDVNGVLRSLRARSPPPHHDQAGEQQHSGGGRYTRSTPSRSPSPDIGSTPLFSREGTGEGTGDRQARYRSGSPSKMGDEDHRVTVQHIFRDSTPPASRPLAGDRSASPPPASRGRITPSPAVVDSRPVASRADVGDRNPAATPKLHLNDPSPVSIREAPRQTPSTAAAVNLRAGPDSLIGRTLGVLLPSGYSEQRGPSTFSPDVPALTSPRGRYDDRGRHSSPRPRAVHVHLAAASPETEAGLRVPLLDGVGQQQRRYASPSGPESTSMMSSMPGGGSDDGSKSSAVEGSRGVGGGSGRSVFIGDRYEGRGRSRSVSPERRRARAKTLSRGRYGSADRVTSSHTGHSDRATRAQEGDSPQEVYTGGRSEASPSPAPRRRPDLEVRAPVAWHCGR